MWRFIKSVPDFEELRDVEENGKNDDGQDVEPGKKENSVIAGVDFINHYWL
jgi:hypothetical protein